MYYNNMLYFTKHVLVRMQERGISAREIKEILQNKYLAYFKKGYVLIGRTNSGKYITLIINPEKHTLITLWPSKRKERRLYEEKIT
jgi:hypothetical protein